jgi:hypothetical protein
MAIPAQYEVDVDAVNLEDNQRVTYSFTVSTDVIGFLLLQTAHSSRRSLKHRRYTTEPLLCWLQSIQLQSTSRAVLGADTAAELGSLPIKAVSCSHDRHFKLYRFTHPKAQSETVSNGRVSKSCHTFWRVSVAGSHVL